MFDFDFFKKSEYVEPAKIDMPKIASGEITQAHYSIGVNVQGLTQLKLHDANTTMTLTLTQEGVNQVIRLLSATLPECCEDEHE